MQSSSITNLSSNYRALPLSDMRVQEGHGGREASGEYCLLRNRPRLPESLVEMVYKPMRGYIDPRVLRTYPYRSFSYLVKVSHLVNVKGGEMFLCFLNKVKSSDPIVQSETILPFRSLQCFYFFGFFLSPDLPLKIWPIISSTYDG